MLGLELSVLEAIVSVHDDSPQTLQLVHQRLGVVSRLAEAQKGALAISDLTQLSAVCLTLRRVLARRLEIEIENVGCCLEPELAVLRCLAALEDNVIEGFDDGPREFSHGGIDAFIASVAQHLAVRVFESAVAASTDDDDPVRKISRVVSTVIARLARSKRASPVIKATLALEFYNRVWDLLEISSKYIATKATAKGVQDLCELLATLSKVSWDFYRVAADITVPNSCMRHPEESLDALQQPLEPFFSALEMGLSSSIPLWASRALSGDSWKPKGDLKTSSSAVDIFDMVSEPLKALTSRVEVPRLNEAISRPVAKALMYYAGALHDSIGDGLIAGEYALVCELSTSKERAHCFPTTSLTTTSCVKANNLSAVLRWLDGLITTMGCGKGPGAIVELEKAFKTVGHTLSSIISFIATWCSIGAERQFINAVTTKNPRHKEHCLRKAFEELDGQLNVPAENLIQDLFQSVLRLSWERIVLALAHPVKGKKSARRSAHVIDEAKAYFSAGLNESALENETVLLIRQQAE
jgi:hypothetical protein